MLNLMDKIIISFIILGFIQEISSLFLKLYGSSHVTNTEISLNGPKLLNLDLIMLFLWCAA